MGVERETGSKGWCSRCQRYQNLQMRKTIHSVPAVLAVNTAISTSEHRRLWATPGWLPEEIGVIVDQGQFFCFEGEDLKLHLQRGIHSITVYSLIGMVVNIESSMPQTSHMVSMINGKSSSNPTRGCFEILTRCSCTCGTRSSSGKQVVPVQ
jgi:PAB-dependent poly(A)-specific ribonuclease subunit 2